MKKIMEFGRAFTLVEILIVVVVLGILAALVLPSIQGTKYRPEEMFGLIPFDYDGYSIGIVQRNSSEGRSQVSIKQGENIVYATISRQDGSRIWSADLINRRECDPNSPLYEYATWIKIEEIVNYAQQRADEKTKD